MNNAIIQRAKKDMWLYMDEKNNRVFRTVVIRPNTSSPWEECTTAEKEQWELEHPMQELIEEVAE